MAFKPVGQGSYPVYIPPSRQKVEGKEDKKGPVEEYEFSPKRPIVIVDYGMGNLRSVQKAMEKAGFPAKISAQPAEVALAKGLILPGVGAFGAAMKNLGQCGLIQPIKDFIRSGRPFLGICLGLQILFESSEEVFDLVMPGLGILSGQVKRFSFSLNPDLPIPHMGWNSLEYRKKLPLMEGIPPGSMFYFVHSYYVDPVDQSLIGATTPYGIDFTSIVQKDNIFATQFHPEKSGPVGLQLLANFGLSVRN